MESNKINRSFKGSYTRLLVYVNVTVKVYILSFAEATRWNQNVCIYVTKFAEYKSFVYHNCILHNPFNIHLPKQPESHHALDRFLGRQMGKLTRNFFVVVFLHSSISAFEILILWYKDWNVHHSRYIPCWVHLVGCAIRTNTVSWSDASNLVVILLSLLYAGKPIHGRARTCSKLRTAEIKLVVFLPVEPR